MVTVVRASAWGDLGYPGLQFGSPKAFDLHKLDVQRILERIGHAPVEKRCRDTLRASRSSPDGDENLQVCLQTTLHPCQRDGAMQVRDPHSVARCTRRSPRFNCCPDCLA